MAQTGGPGTELLKIMDGISLNGEWWNFPAGTVMCNQPRVRPVFNNLLSFWLHKPSYYVITYTFSIPPDGAQVIFKQNVKEPPNG